MAYASKEASWPCLQNVGDKDLLGRRRVAGSRGMSRRDSEEERETTGTGREANLILREPSKELLLPTTRNANHQRTAPRVDQREIRRVQITHLANYCREGNLPSSSFP